MTPPEARIAKAGQAVLTNHGAWFAPHEPNGATGDRNGIPDLIFIHRGQGGVIEFKTPTGRLSPLQEHELRQVEKAGGIALVARCAGDVEAMLCALEDIDDLRCGPSEVTA